VTANMNAASPVVYPLLWMEEEGHMTIVFWVLGGLFTGLILIGVAELLKGPQGRMTREDKWWQSDLD